MSELPLHAAGLLVLWGALVALDLVSVPQAMLSRPLVAGTVAGWLVGDLEAGLRVGVLLELFALDVLPIGAVRYPDYGPATVAAATLAAGAPWELGLGLSVTLGLLLAVLGGWTLQLVRRSNARAIQQHAAALAAGESRAIRRLQYGALLRDAARGAGLTLLGLALASGMTRYVHLDRRTAVGLTLVVIGAGISAAAGGAVRSAGRGARLKWLLAGVAAGILLAVLR
ncbi:MAG TPA: PTS sugar transporter subunit IIC [Gemmatimonadales bacterium]|jgi:PTS system mannose-specific IIC component|nr:PTS sugar transporter subunit IIC [Gemmatimonadales bacterium]